MTDIIVVTDLGSVDIDDVLALLLLKQYKDQVNIKGIITTHHFAKERAKVAQLLVDKMEMNTNIYYHETPIKNFKKENPLWPDFFGYPEGTEDTKSDKQWFPDFLKAYKENYDINKYEDKIKNNGVDFLTGELKNHSFDNKLVVICMAPPHIFENINPELFKSGKFFFMGGGFETFNKDSMKVDKMGYNWGITPLVTKKLLEKFTISKTKLNLITSNFVRKNNISACSEHIKIWSKLGSKMAQTIMKDWDYCTKGNLLTTHKNLCDPLTMYIGLETILGNRSFEYVEIDYNIDDSEIDGYIDYLEKNKPDIFIIKKDKDGNTNIYTKLESDKVLKKIIRKIDKTMMEFN